MRDDVRTSTGNRSLQIVVATIVIGLATVIRLWQARDDLWLDELHSAWAISGGLGSVAERAAIGNQPPLYFWVLWTFTQILGVNEFGLRATSLISSVGLLVLTYRLVFTWTKNHVAALTPLILAAVGPNMIFYATEARPYAFLQLLALSQIALFWQLVKPSEDPRWPTYVGFVLLTAACCYTHFTAALLIATELLFLAAVELMRIWDERRSASKENASRQRTLPIVGVFFAAGLLVLPLIPTLLQILERRQNWGQMQAAPGNFSDLLAAHQLLLYFAVPALILVIALVHRPFVRQPLAMPRYLVLTLFWTLLPITLLAFAIRQTNDFQLPTNLLRRYTVFSLIGPMIVSGVYLVRLRNVVEQLVVLSLVVAVSLGQSGILANLRAEGRFLTDRHEHWPAAVSWVNEQHEPGDVVFVYAGLIEGYAYAQSTNDLEQDYCLLPVNNIYKVDATTEYRAYPLPTLGTLELKTWFKKHADVEHTVWMVLRVGRQTCGIATENVRAKTQWRDVETREFGNVCVVRCELDHD